MWLCRLIRLHGRHSTNGTKMDRPGRDVLSWDQLKPEQPVHFYGADGWKKGTVVRIFPTRCSVLWTKQSKPTTTNVYDVRNLRLQ